MVKKTYSEKLLDPRWQKKRLKILERDEFSCRFCEDTDNTLHIHHLTYTDGNPWEISDNLLITLCADCHEVESKDIKHKSSALISDMKNLGMTSHDFFNLMIFFHQTKTSIKWSMNKNIFDALEYAITEESFFKKVVINYNKVKKTREIEAKKDVSYGLLDNDLPF